MSYDSHRDPNLAYGNPPYGVLPSESNGQSQNSDDVPPQGPYGQLQGPPGSFPQAPYGQPLAPHGYGDPPQGPYGAFPYQQPGYGYGSPPGQATSLPFGEAIRQLPRQYLKVLTKWSPTTFAEEQGKASWGIVWVQLVFMIIGAAVEGYLAGVNLVVDIPIAIVAIPIAIFFTAGIYYLIARAFGGQGTFLAQTYTTLLFNAPLAILAASFNVIPGLLGIERIVTAFGFLLSVFMIMGVHRLSRGKAIAVIFTPVAVIAIIAVLLVIVTVAVRVP
jgi:hypothetical protein